MPGWLCDLLVNFAGAFLGVFLGYGASRLLASQEAGERRSVLIETLKEQLAGLPDPSMVGTANIRRVIAVSALGHLLSGDALDANRTATRSLSFVLGALMRRARGGIAGKVSRTHPSAGCLRSGPSAATLHTGRWRRTVEVSRHPSGAHTQRARCKSGALSLCTSRSGCERNVKRERDDLAIVTLLL